MKDKMTTQTPADEFSRLFESRHSTLKIAQGEPVTGRVVRVQRDHVVVNIGFKSEGYISKEEFRNLDGEITVEPGTEVRVVVEEVEDDRGNMILSKERADALQAWDLVESVFKDNSIIEGLVVNKVKGGLSVNLGGIKAFLPGSQIDLKPVKSLDKLIGHKYTFKILKLNQSKGNIVLSRRAILEEERIHLKRDILDNIKEGQIIRGTVKNLTDYGAFIDLGGIDGLLHITDMTWGRVGHPNEVVKVNEEIDVVVLKYDPQSEKVSLGLKQLQDDPWNKSIDQFTPGERIKGKVVQITDFGVFVELATGVEGLVHVSELSWSKKAKHPSKIVNMGDVVETVILDIDKAARKVSLGLKQLEPNPWDVLHQKFPVNSHVTGKIRNITDFGIFVGLDNEEIDGLIHVSDISWDKNFKWPNDQFKKGQDVEAMVINIDRENKKFSLGLKQLSDDPFAIAIRTYALGTEVKGAISEVSDRGVTVKIAEEVFGFIPGNETGVAKSSVKDHFKIGDEVSAQVKKIDDRDRRLVLSIKGLQRRMEKDNMKDFLNKQGDASVTLSDLMKPS